MVNDCSKVNPKALKPEEIIKLGNNIFYQQSDYTRKTLADVRNEFIERNTYIITHYQIDRIVDMPPIYTPKLQFISL